MNEHDISDEHADWYPTARLRWFHKTPEKALSIAFLQQLWKSYTLDESEWRDVPVDSQEAP